MSNAEWTYVLVAGFAFWIVLRRFDRLGKQLEAVCTALKIEVAKSAGNKERADEMFVE
jgi:hypothetical protein